MPGLLSRRALIYVAVFVQLTCLILVQNNELHRIISSIIVVDDRHIIFAGTSDTKKEEQQRSVAGKTDEMPMVNVATDTGVSNDRFTKEERDKQQSFLSPPSVPSKSRKSSASSQPVTGQVKVPVATSSLSQQNSANLTNGSNPKPRLIEEDEVREWFIKEPPRRVPINNGSTPLSRRTNWSNDYDVVHVITSRFMQDQAKLKHLARARLELLKAITLPSLQQQTNQDFLWILRIDPKLDAVTLSSLLDATKSMDNLVVFFNNTSPGGFRNISKDRYDNLANPESRMLLESYIDAAQSRPVLETRLDADDALMLGFVEQLQQNARLQFNSVADEWAIWCVDDHLEWQQNSPWHGNLSAIVGWKASHCVTPGLTRGSPVGGIRNRPEARHHKIHLTVPPCLNKTLHGTPIGSCLHRLRSAWPMAVRARTITSAGMADLVLDQSDKLAKSLRESHWRNLQDAIFARMEALFGISPHSLHRLRQDLIEHMHEVAVDALEGQCTLGHSCKNQSKKALQQLVAKTETAKHK